MVLEMLLVKLRTQTWSLLHSPLFRPVRDPARDLGSSTREEIILDTPESGQWTTSPEVYRDHAQHSLCSSDQGCLLHCGCTDECTRNHVNYEDRDFTSGSELVDMPFMFNLGHLED